MIAAYARLRKTSAERQCHDYLKAIDRVVIPPKAKHFARSVH